MGRFSAIAKGTRATRPVVLAYGGADVPLAVRPLNAAEEADALAEGRAYAVGKGIAAPAPTDRLYEIGYMASTLVLGCVDADDPAAPFFASAAEVLDNLDTDRIAYLYEQQQAWQDWCSPRPKDMDAGEFIALVLRLAEEGAGADADDPLVMLRPSLRLSFARTLARQYQASLTRRSPSGSAAEPGTSTPPAPAAQPTDAAPAS
jgi:hypothetical protein